MREATLPRKRRITVQRTEAINASMDRPMQ
jgi:hypothetical protein